MLLQSTGIRISLCMLSEFHTFNHRSISTWAIESSYSDLSIADIIGTGCPRVYNILNLMSMLVEYNTAKHDPTKLFKMDSCRGGPYITHLLDTPSNNLDSNSTGDSNISIFKSHI